jgi:hypothetical protein
MLASLLPGLRDIRTPLAVGYLWLLTAWLLFGEYVPKSRPPGNGLIAQLFDLGGLLGRAAPIAALSFIAYLLGAILTIPVESRFISRLLLRMGVGSVGTRLTSQEYIRRQEDLVGAFLQRLAERRKTEQQLDYIDADIPVLRRLGVDFAASGGELKHVRYSAEWGVFLGANDLRARLLIANQQLYGEYDRLAAEASFRVNMTLPLLVLSGLVFFGFNQGLGLGMILGAWILLVQGAARLLLSITVLQRAVLADVIKDPLAEKLREILNRDSSQPYRL